MRNELEKLIEAAENVAKLQSEYNLGKLDYAIKKAKLALQQPDVMRRNFLTTPCGTCTQFQSVCQKIGRCKNMM